MQTMGATRGPTHLVALYVATAGLQGNALGSDEEEITLLVYVLIDVLQNKVCYICRIIIGKEKKKDRNEKRKVELIQEYKIVLNDSPICVTHFLHAIFMSNIYNNYNSLYDL